MPASASSAGAEDRPDDGDEDQRLRHGADDRQLLHEGRQAPQDRQERDQRHHRIDQADAEALHGGGEAHGVFLDALRGAFDRAQPLPVGDVVVVHRRAPAEDVVADQEGVEDGDEDVDHRDGQEGRRAERNSRLPVTLLGVAERLLDQVVERAEPVVDQHVELDLEPDDEQDHRRADHRPPEPADAATDRRQTSAKMAPPTNMYW